jgi:hypothetical protein
MTNVTRIAMPSWPPIATFRIVASRKEEAPSPDIADRIAGDDVWRQLFDNGCDHRIEVAIKVTASKGI